MPPARLKFALVVTIPEQLPRNIEVLDHLFAGLDPRSDLILIDSQVKNRQFLFQKKENTLCVQLLGPDKGSFLNNQAMEKGKMYLLDRGDRIEVGRVTIKIQTSDDEGRTFPHQPRPLNFQSMEELTPELKISEQKIVHEKLEPPKTPKPPPEKQVIRKQTGSTPILIHLKMQALVLDFFLTYMILIPLVALTNTELQTYRLINDFPENSIIRFLIFVWIFKNITSLLFSRSLGEALTGLYSEQPTIARRLGSLLFYSFHTHAKNNFFFSFQRKIGFLFVILWSLITPFFLPIPFSTQVLIEKENIPTQKTLQTTSVHGHSKDLGMTLKAEVDGKNILLPILARNGRRSFSFTAIESDEEIIVLETRSLPYQQITQMLQIGNPFYQRIKDKIKMKELVIALLGFAPLQVGPLYQLLGPFWGSAFIVKKNLLLEMIGPDIVTVHPFTDSLPLIKLQNRTSESLLLFARDRLVVFKIIQPMPYSHDLQQALYQSVLTQFYLDETEDFGVTNKEVDILTAQDDWSRGNLTGPLTYFKNEAIKLSKTNVMTRNSGIIYQEKKKTLFLKNLARMELNLRDETLAKSVEDIKNLLKDEVLTNDRKSSGKQNVRKNPRPGQRTLQIRSRSRR